MANEVERPTSGLGSRIVIAVLVIVTASLVLRFLLGFVFGLIRALFFLALVGVVAWFVIVGPPGRDEV